MTLVRPPQSPGDAHDRPLTTNPLCPDYSSHHQNAIDRLYPHGIPVSLTVDEWATIDAAADDEYAQCEGHS